MRLFRFSPVLLLLLFACRQPADQTARLQRELDSLNQKLANTYHPGLGEFMSAIQMHHAKLYFAGQQENWPLAEFEWQEIQENVEAIQQQVKDRSETRLLYLLNGPSDSVKLAIDHRNKTEFLNRFQVLTNTCNSCHREVGFSFNKIIIPTRPPVTNQDFSQ